jgi:hypothetical protein
MAQAINIFHDKKQHTSPKRVSVRRRLIDGAVAKIGERITDGSSFDVAFYTSIQQMWLLAGTMGLGALKVDRMARRVAAKVS